MRRDAALTGICLVICACGAVFWSTTGLDQGWFLLQRLELPTPLRVVLLTVLLPLLLWLTVRRIAFPLVRRIADADVALLLERRFPQFQDRLLTSVEAAAGYPEHSPLVEGMLRRAAGEAESLSVTTPAAGVFDPRSLRQLAAAAGVLSLSVIIPGLLQPGLLPRWWSAFVLCDDVYHLRTTALEVFAVAQPGDRRREFQQEAEHLVYRHPRMADLELELVVPERDEVSGREWVVPERVRIDVTRPDGTRSRVFVSSTSPRTFRFVMTRLQEAVTVEFLAGDYRSAVPYEILPVTPPSIDAIDLDCHYPDYTGWNQLRETAIRVTGSEVSLPLGTTFRLSASSAKPLQSARILSDLFELSGDRETTRVIPREGFQPLFQHLPPLLSPDGRTVSVAFALSAGTETAGPQTGSGTTAAADGKPDASGGLPVASNTALRFFLHDDDDVMSVNPEVLRFRGIEDRPPVITARGSGIDTAVTRLARIPITGRIQDDYGIASAGFRFLVDDETGWRPRPFRRPPAEGMLEFDLQREEGQPFEVFDVQPLELSEGQTLTLAVAAQDGNPASENGETRSEPLIFRVVSNEELLSLLYTREIALRRRFEEVISQLEQVRDDLLFHQEVSRRLDTGDSAAIRPEDQVAVTTCATRSGNMLRRQTNELNAIARGFDEIVEQLINNAVPPKQLAENMRTRIPDPIRQLTGQPVTDADRAIGEFRVAAIEARKTLALLQASHTQVSQIVITLRQILENVRDLAEFHEALRDLKAILEEQQRLLNETRALQKRRLIDQLKGLK